jgi:hypothetical protein
MKNFKQFIKEQSQPQVAPNPTENVFKYFNDFVKGWQDSSQDQKNAIISNNQARTNFLNSLYGQIKILNDNPDETREYLKDSNNKESFKKNVDELISIIYDIFGSGNNDIVGVVQQLKDLKTSLEKPAIESTPLDTLGKEELNKIFTSLGFDK